jgi:hypothetical protein
MLHVALLILCICTSIFILAMTLLFVSSEIFNHRAKKILADQALRLVKDTKDGP